jgi:hypothetical protein
MRVVGYWINVKIKTEKVTCPGTIEYPTTTINAPNTAANFNMISFLKTQKNMFSLSLSLHTLGCPQNTYIINKGVIVRAYASLDFQPTLYTILTGYK